MAQDLIGLALPNLGRTRSLVGNVAATGLVVAAWGWFLYRGVIDPLGGINTLWPLFGIANQMLAAIALTFATVAIAKKGLRPALLVTVAPLVWLLICTLTAAAQKLIDPDPKLSFLAHAAVIRKGLADGVLVAPAKTVVEMNQLLINDVVDAAMCVLFTGVVVAMAVLGFRALRLRLPTAEAPREDALAPVRA
jgi:carbon starvation protein